MHIHGTKRLACLLAALLLVGLATPALAGEKATIGAVGDLMVMQIQLRGAWDDSLQNYDFAPSFRSVQKLMQSADIMCLNLETPLAGAEASYSGPAPKQPESGKRVLQTFNAPDSLADTLAALGVDIVSTANNHCLDRGAAGLQRTPGVLRKAGLTPVGTYLSPQDREKPRILTANGIRIGFVAWTNSVNGYDKQLNSNQRTYAVGRTGSKDVMLEDITLCRDAGAEFIVAFPHWDSENVNKPGAATRKLAKWMLENGVDAIIGAHPHVVQPIEYMQVEREDGPYTGLVAYSMGNFISNMSRTTANSYGLFLQITVERAQDGGVYLSDAAIMPLYNVRHQVDGRLLHEVVQAPADISRVISTGPLSSQTLQNMQKARKHVLQIAGRDVRVLG